MIELSRFTTSYVETEDRIRLSGVSDDGQTWTLWLTQRLLNRLAPFLCAQIGPQEQNERTTLINSFEQMAAVQNIKPLPPVEQVTNGTVFTPQAVRIETGSGLVRVIFKERDEGEGRLASVSFREEPLRQWLAILHQQYAKAEWVMSHWPAWITAQPQLDLTRETFLN